jgi:hypothetical protein
LPILASAALQRILRAAGRLKHQLWAVRSELDGGNKITAATVPPIGLIKAVLPSLPNAAVFCQSMDERHFRNFLIDLGAQDRAPYAGGA